MDERLNIVLFNQDWLISELRSLGHNVISVGLREHCFDLVLPRAGMYLSEVLGCLPFKPDRLVYFDDSSTPWIYGLEKNDIPTVFYSVDTHHHYLWHRSFAELFDSILLAQYDYLEMFRSVHPRVNWFPLWVSRFSEPQPDKNIEVSFRGSMDPELHPRRVKFFEELRGLVGVDAGEGDFPSIYRQSKIVINENVRAHLNFRVFESMGCGAMLLTPAHCGGLTELFENKVDLVTYEGDNPEDAAEKIRYYLANEAERSDIATRGYQRVHRLHSARARAKDLERELFNCQVRPKPHRHLAATRSCLTTYAAIRQKGLRWDFDLLREAQRQLVLSAGAQEEVGGETLASGLLLKCYLDEAGRFDESVALTEALVAKYPEENTLKIFYLGDLVRSGEQAQARSYALTFTDKADELLASLPALLESCKSRILLGEANL